MRARTPALALSVTLAAVAALSGCSAASPQLESSTPPVAEPGAAPSLTPNPPEPDSILWIRATATASNGSTLDLEAMVHRSLSYQYPGSQTLNQMLIDDCGATLTNAILTADAWSITRMNVTAIPPVGSGEWPADERVGLRPSGDVVYVAGRGMMQADPATGELACTQDKFFVGSGRGAIAVGIPGDTIDLDNFRGGWATRTWGFTAPDGVVLTDCSFEITDLGRQVGAGTGWVEIADDANCYVGPTTEPSVF